MDGARMPDVEDQVKGSLETTLATLVHAKVKEGRASAHQAGYPGGAVSGHLQAEARIVHFGGAWMDGLISL